MEKNKVFLMVFFLLVIFAGTALAENCTYLAFTGSDAARRGDQKEAVALYTAAINCGLSRDNLVICYYNRSICFANSGQYDDAIIDCNRTLELNPRHKKAYHNRGNCYQAKGQYDKAIADYNKAIKIDPDYKPAIYSRDRLLSLNKEH